MTKSPELNTHANDELDDKVLEQATGGISPAHVAPTPHHNPPDLVNTGTIGGSPHIGGWSIQANTKV